MTMGTSLLQLPVELLNRVCEALPFQDVKRLRLVNKEILDKSRRYFIARCFCSITFDASQNVLSMPEPYGLDWTFAVTDIEIVAHGPAHQKFHSAHSREIHEHTTPQCNPPCCKCAGAEYKKEQTQISALVASEDFKQILDKLVRLKSIKIRGPGSCYRDEFPGYPVYKGLLGRLPGTLTKLNLHSVVVPTKHLLHALEAIKASIKTFNMYAAGTDWGGWIPVFEWLSRGAAAKLGSVELCRLSNSSIRMTKYGRVVYGHDFNFLREEERLARALAPTTEYRRVSTYAMRRYEVKALGLPAIKAAALKILEFHGKRL